jgi:hypothetical protein
MDELDEVFSSLFTPEIIDDAKRSYDRDMSSQNKNIHAIPPDPTSSIESRLNLKNVDISNKDSLQALFMNSMAEAKPRFLPLECLPCANVEIQKYKACPKPGTKTCSSCKLVSYCSAVSG